MVLVEPCQHCSSNDCYTVARKTPATGSHLIASHCDVSRLFVYRPYNYFSKDAVGSEVRNPTTRLTRKEVGKARQDMRRVLSKKKGCVGQGKGKGEVVASHPKIV